MSNNKPQNIHPANHPLITHKLTQLRDKKTDRQTFRRLVHEISLLLVYLATQDLPVTKHTVITPLEEMQGEVLADKAPVVIPIMRAGLGMLDAFLTLFPQAKVGHIGLKRNEQTLQSERYYYKIPHDSKQRPIFMIDPMLATGGSLVSAISKLKEDGLSNIRSINIIAAPEGIDHVHNEHPDVPIYIAGIDPGLDKHAYIVPGLGDAGDRLYGTEE